MLNISLLVDEYELIWEISLAFQQDLIVYGFIPKFFDTLLDKFKNDTKMYEIKLPILQKFLPLMKK